MQEISRISFCLTYSQVGIKRFSEIVSRPNKKEKQMQLSIGLVKNVSVGKNELTDKQLEALRDFQASGFEITIDGLPLQAYTSVNGEMPEAIGKFGEEMFSLVSAAIFMQQLGKQSPEALLSRPNI